MNSRRLYRITLANGLSIKACGAFGTGDKVAWSQPPDAWQTMLLHPAATVVLNGEESPTERWTLLVVPPSARCEVRWEGEPPFVYDYFGFAPEAHAEGALAVPQLTALGASGPFWDIEFRKGLGALSRSPAHVGAVARALLWSVALPSSELCRNVYVAEAERLIAAEKGPRLKIADLAQQVGLSQSQLNRLFLAEHGATTLQFIRNTQAQRAHRLLTRTVQPVKGVAAACGFPDLQTFNRFVRSRLGASPREIRAGMGTVDVFRVEEYREKNIG